MTNQEIVLSSNTLCHRAVSEGILVSVKLGNQEICRVVPRNRDEKQGADVVAHLLDGEASTCKAKPTTLAGELFLSLLVAGA